MAHSYMDMIASLMGKRRHLADSHITIAMNTSANVRKKERKGVGPMQTKADKWEGRANFG